MKDVSILGSTGSVGRLAFDILSSQPEKYRIRTLVTYKNTELLLQQCNQVDIDCVVIIDELAGAHFRRAIDQSNLPIKVEVGYEGFLRVSELDNVDVVIAALGGTSSLIPISNYLKSRSKVLIANKEPLVIAGKALIDLARTSGAEIIPVDSEHSAIFQCLGPSYTIGQPIKNLRNLILTCSGGPFRTASIENIKTASVEETLNHPTWKMGKKISVDSATLMNKGLEIIEASVLFNTPVNRIDVVVHPQSIIHGMVEFTDGSTMAALNEPSMKQPIMFGLERNETYTPTKFTSVVELLTNNKILSFEQPDYGKFPCLSLARWAAEEAGVAPLILNAANDLAVNAFLDKRIALSTIPNIVKECLTSISATSKIDLSNVNTVMTTYSEIASICESIAEKVIAIEKM